jgi:hypothetical protein
MSKCETTIWRKRSLSPDKEIVFSRSLFSTQDLSRKKVIFGGKRRGVTKTTETRLIDESREMDLLLGGRRPFPANYVDSTLSRVSIVPVTNITLIVEEGCLRCVTSWAPSRWTWMWGWWKKSVSDEWRHQLWVGGDKCPTFDIDVRLVEEGMFVMCDVMSWALVDGKRAC